MRIHVIQATANPSTAPAFVGQHYINTSSSRHWLAKGTATTADWVEFAALGSGSIVDTGSYGSPQTVAGSGALTFPSDQRARFFIASTSGAVTGVTVPATSTGTREVYIVGTSDSNTVQMASATNLKLSGTIVMKAGTLLSLQEVPGLAKWVEVSRNEI